SELLQDARTSLCDIQAQAVACAVIHPEKSGRSELTNWHLCHRHLAPVQLQFSVWSLVVASRQLIPPPVQVPLVRSRIPVQPHHHPIIGNAAEILASVRVAPARS